VLVLHHAPLPPPSPLLSYFALETSSRVALLEAIRGTDVRLILAGHHHLPQSGMLGPIPVAVAGSTAIRTDPLAEAGHERTWAGGAVNLVEVYPDTITVSVIPVDGYAAATTAVNQTRYGLSSSIFTTDANTAFRAMRDFETGIVYVNAGTTGAETHLPFGGWKETGNGHREAGHAALDTYTEWKSIYVDFSGRLQRAQIDNQE
jgi:hypothetical protein